MFKNDSNVLKFTCVHFDKDTMSFNIKTRNTDINTIIIISCIDRLIDSLDSHSFKMPTGLESFLPFHIVHGVLKARILNWLAIAFSSRPHFVRILRHDPSVLGGPTWHGS